MWEAVKNALMSVKEATGIEIPGLPADLGSIGDSAATAVQSVTDSVTESATSVLDGAATAAEAAAGGAAGVAETAATTADSASQALPDLTGGLFDGSPEK